MNVIVKYNYLDTLRGKTIQDILLLADGIEIIPTEGQSVIINIKLPDHVIFEPQFRKLKTIIAEEPNHELSP